MDTIEHVQDMITDVQTASANGGEVEGNALNIHKVGIEPYLNDKAKQLMAIEIKKTLFAAPDGEIHPCAFASATVKLNDKGTIDDSDVRRWPRFLNDLADKDVWQFGTLAPPSFLTLAKGSFDLNGFVREPSDSGVIFTFIFTKYSTDVDLISTLNKEMNVNVFYHEGEIGVHMDEKFPY